MKCVNRLCKLLAWHPTEKIVKRNNKITKTVLPSWKGFKSPRYIPETKIFCDKINQVTRLRCIRRWIRDSHARPKSNSKQVLNEIFIFYAKPIAIVFAIFVATLIIVLSTFLSTFLHTNVPHSCQYFHKINILSNTTCVPYRFVDESNCICRHPYQKCEEIEIMLSCYKHSEVCLFIAKKPHARVDERLI